MRKKIITLRLDAASKIILLVLGAGVWFMALRPIGSSSANCAETDIAGDPVISGPFAPANFGSTSINSSKSVNLVQATDSRFAPAPWNSLGQNQMMIERGLADLVRTYGYSRLEAYAHYICWELSAIERRGIGSN
jgi:hypothetical protein